MARAVWNSVIIYVSTLNINLISLSVKNYYFRLNNLFRSSKHISTSGIPDVKFYICLLYRNNL